MYLLVRIAFLTRNSNPKLQPTGSFSDVSLFVSSTLCRNTTLKRLWKVLVNCFHSFNSWLLCWLFIFGKRTLSCLGTWLPAQIEIKQLNLEVSFFERCRRVSMRHNHTVECMKRFDCLHGCSFHPNPDPPTPPKLGLCSRQSNPRWSESHGVVMGTKPDSPVAQHEPRSLGASQLVKFQRVKK